MTDTDFKPVELPTIEQTDTDIALAAARRQWTDFDGHIICFHPSVGWARIKSPAVSVEHRATRRTILAHASPEKARDFMVKLRALWQAPETSARFVDFLTDSNPETAKETARALGIEDMARAIPRWHPEPTFVDDEGNPLLYEDQTDVYLQDEDGNRYCIEQGEAAERDWDCMVQVSGTIYCTIRAATQEEAEEMARDDWGDHIYDASEYLSVDDVSVEEA